MRIQRKWCLALLTTLALALGVLCGTAWAAETASTQDEGPALMAEVVQSGTCGENVTWTLDDDGTLTISGTGEMDDYDGVIIEDECLVNMTP